jgi:hypothetical protein
MSIPQMLATEVKMKVEGPEDDGGRNWITGTLLVVFTVLVAFSCIVLLATTLTQSRVSTLTIDGLTVGIRKLDFAGRRWVDATEDNKKKLAELSHLISERNQSAYDAAKAESAYNAATKKLEDLLAEFYHRVASSHPDFAALIRNRGYSDQVGRILGARDTMFVGNSDYASLIASIEGAYKPFRESEDDNDAAQAKLTTTVVASQIIPNVGPSVVWWAVATMPC